MQSKIRKLKPRFKLFALLVACSLVAGCNSNVGVGVSVGVPIGNHGHMSIGTSRWF